MKTNKRQIAFIIIGVLLLVMMNYYMYQFNSPNGHMKRDLEYYFAGMSNDEVKTIWCGIKDYPTPYIKYNNTEYCGDIEVKVDCYFSNGGESCSINEIKGDKE